jgi:hypothetical protein
MPGTPPKPQMDTYNLLSLPKVMAVGKLSPEAMVNLSGKLWMLLLSDYITPADRVVFTKGRSHMPIENKAQVLNSAWY